MTATRRMIALVLIAAVAMLASASEKAQAQSISSGSANTSGSTTNSNSGDGSNNASVNIQTNNGTVFKTRFAWNLNADVGVFSTRQQNGSAQHNLSFNVTAPGAYFLTVDTDRVGDMNRINDASGCDGSADVSSVGGGFTGGTLTSGSLSLADPGSIPNGGATTSGPVNQSATARIDRVSNGVAQGHTLTFTWNGNARSNSCEAAVRFGEGSGNTSGCSACGYPGSPSRTQLNDGHFVQVTLTSLCGNGVVDGPQGEDCDTALGTICCDSTCQFRSSSTQCRATGGVCDNAENCTGSSAACPSDGFKPNSTVCRAATGGICDAVENCTGSTAACPGDSFLVNGTPCRASGGICDVVENCTGSSPTCPGNGFQSSATVCRNSAGVCDNAENCTGSGAACPPNGFKSSAIVCRDAVGVCDLDENCPGASAACPADAKSSSVCRPTGGFCDVAESCDGSTNNCPADQVQPISTACRAGVGVCDAEETCDGVGIFCPPDAKSSTACRAATDVCDLVETCDGVGDDCPGDGFQPASVECRGSGGVCDAVETCTGSGASCPADDFAPASTVCRADTGDCDVVETCTGSGVDCPSDVLEADGTSCSDSNACTLDDICAAGVCTGDSMLCGDGTLQGGCGEQCDDNNLDAGDGCSPTCQVEPGLGCTAGPLTGCLRPFVPRKATIQFIRKGGIKDQIKWKWLKGERTTLADYGTPLTTTSYQVCIFDQTGLRFAISNPAGGMCAGKACWKATGSKGFSYKDKDLTPNGGSQLKLKEGALAKAQIQFTGKGSALALPDLTTLAQPLTVQIQNTNGVCWEAIYSGPPTSQTSTQFKDKAD